MIVCCCYDTFSLGPLGGRPRLPPCCYVFLTDAPLKPAMILQLSCRSPRIQQDLTYVDLLANDDIHLIFQLALLLLLGLLLLEMMPPRGGPGSRHFSMDTLSVSCTYIKPETIAMLFPLQV